MEQPDWRNLLEQTQRLALSYLESLPGRRISPSAAADHLLASVDRPLSAQGCPPGDVLEELALAVEPGLTAMNSGRFVGWVIGGTLPAALGADWLTAAWDQNAGSVEGTPAAAALEQVALGWVRDLLGLPEGVSSALVTGAQMANTVGLAAARHHVLRAAGHDVETEGLSGAPPIKVLVSAEQHDTVLRSLKLLGLGTRAVITIPTDGQGRQRADAFTEALGQVRGPTIVCAQAGNVNTGSFDPLVSIVRAVKEARERMPVWLHVDGAFGLWARVSPDHRGQADGIEQADSWATDAHKWLNTPYDCGIAFTSHPASHKAALSIHAAYLPEQDFGVRNPFDWTPELSRRARGFVLWAALRQLGRDGVRQLVDRCCNHARRFAQGIAALPGADVLNEVTLNQVLVRFRDPADRDDDDHTRQVIGRLHREGTCYPTGTVWHGVAAMRISVSGWSTDAEDVERSLESIARAHMG